MSVQFHDPKAEPLAAPEPYRLGVAFVGDVTIGMLANGFPDSVEFLQAVESSLSSVLPRAQFKRFNKGDPSIPVPDEMLAELVEDCDAVVAAYGH